MQDEKKEEKEGKEGKEERCLMEKGGIRGVTYGGEGKTRTDG